MSCCGKPNTGDSGHKRLPVHPQLRTSRRAMRVPVVVVHGEFCCFDEEMCAIFRVLKQKHCSQPVVLPFRKPVRQNGNENVQKRIYLWLKRPRIVLKDHTSIAGSFGRRLLIML